MTDINKVLECLESLMRIEKCYAEDDSMSLSSRLEASHRYKAFSLVNKVMNDEGFANMLIKINK